MSSLIRVKSILCWYEVKLITLSIDISHVWLLFAIKHSLVVFHLFWIRELIFLQRNCFVASISSLVTLIWACETKNWIAWVHSNPSIFHLIMVEPIHIIFYSQGQVTLWSCVYFVWKQLILIPNKLEAICMNPVFAIVIYSLLLLGDLKRLNP